MDQSYALLLAIAAVLLALSTAFVLPYLQFFLLAVLLAYVLRPLQRRLERHVRAGIAAGALVTGTTVVLLLPVILVGRVVVREARQLLESVRAGDITLDRVEAAIERGSGYEVDLTGAIRSAIGDGGAETVGGLLGVFDTVTHVLIGLGLTVFLLYYFLKDGDSFGRWLRRTLPLPRRVQTELYEEVDGIMRAVLAGHVLVAAVQGVLAGVGLLVTGIPNALFWTVVMSILSLLPVVGSFMVWGPAVAYLFVIGRPAAALFLFVWGAVVVGVSDDYLRPVVVDRYARVNPGVVLLGILGGITVIGVMGIFFGPILIGALRATLEVFREEYVPATG